MTRPGKIGAEAALKELPKWAKAEGGRDAIRRTFRFSDFTAAFSWMTRMALNEPVRKRARHGFVPPSPTT